MEVILGVDIFVANLLNAKISSGQEPFVTYEEIKNYIDTVKDNCKEQLKDAIIYLDLGRLEDYGNDRIFEQEETGISLHKKSNITQLKNKLKVLQTVSPKIAKAMANVARQMLDNNHTDGI